MTESAEDQHCSDFYCNDFRANALHPQGTWFLSNWGCCSLHDVHVVLVLLQYHEHHLSAWMGWVFSQTGWFLWHTRLDHQHLPCCLPWALVAENSFTKRFSTSTSVLLGPKSTLSPPGILSSSQGNCETSSWYQTPAYSLKMSAQVCPQSSIPSRQTAAISVSWDEVGHTFKISVYLSITSIPVEVKLIFVCSRCELLGDFISGFFFFLNSLKHRLFIDWIVP